MARAGWTQAQNHPQPGSSIKVEPIRDLEAIRRIKVMLRDNPRDLCLFTMGINTAYRAGELMSLTVGKVRHLRAGDRLEIKQPKTGRHRMTRMNEIVVRSIGAWLSVHPDPRPRCAAVSFDENAKGVDRAERQSSGQRMVRRGWCERKLRIAHAAKDLGLSPEGDVRETNRVDFAGARPCQRGADIAVSRHFAGGDR